MDTIKFGMIRLSDGEWSAHTTLISDFCFVGTFDEAIKKAYAWANEHQLTIEWKEPVIHDIQPECCQAGKYDPPMQTKVQNSGQIMRNVELRMAGLNYVTEDEVNALRNKVLNHKEPNMPMWRRLINRSR